MTPQIVVARVEERAKEAGRAAGRAEACRTFDTLLAGHETNIAKLTIGKEGVVRSTNIRYETRDLRRRLERVRAEDAEKPGGEEK